MCVGDEDEGDEGDEVDVESRDAEAFDDAVPAGPVWVDEDGVFCELEEEGSVADPGDAGGAWFGWMGNGIDVCAEAFFEDLSEDTGGEEFDISFDPALFWEDASVVFAGDFFRIVRHWLRNVLEDW